MAKYYPTIGLEIHAELATNTKMFSAAANDPDAASPNINIDPVSIAEPGTLPVANMTAIASMVKIGLAVKGNIAERTQFDRKHYFYPDIPKGYQISQYQHPIVSGGSLAGVEITRIHLEEDTGTSKHSDGRTLIDYNRAGVPLMELVTEPVIHDAETAMRFARELQLLLRYLGVAHGNMEKGEMRVEANISISPIEGELGTKVEVKNLNSFNVVGRAIEYEVARMTALHEAGRADEIIQETRGWDDAKQKTFSQRSKENSEEYRYFPDPDLPKLYLHDLFDLEKISSELPELPAERRERYAQDFGIKDEDIETYVNDNDLAVLFENTVISLAGQPELIKLASNYLTSDIVGMMRSSDGPDRAQILDRIEAEKFSTLIKMNQEGLLNSRGVKDILLIMATEGGDPAVIAEEQGLIQKNDPAELQKIAEKIVADNPEQAAQYRAGKETLVKFFVGQGMKETGGSANPTVLEDLFTQLLKQE